MTDPLGATVILTVDKSQAPVVSFTDSELSIGSNQTTEMPGNYTIKLKLEQEVPEQFKDETWVILRTREYTM
jgi:hypothetical protein